MAEYKEQMGTLSHLDEFSTLSKQAGCCGKQRVVFERSFKQHYDASKNDPDTPHLQKHKISRLDSAFLGIWALPGIFSIINSQLNSKQRITQEVAIAIFSLFNFLECGRTTWLQERRKERE